MPAEMLTPSRARVVRRRTRWGWAGAGAALLAAAWWLLMSGVPAAPPPPAVPGDAARGAQLLAHYQCGRCHDIPGVASARGVEGPSLSGIGRRVYIAGELPNRPDVLQRWIVDPAALVPGSAMPAMGVGDRDARDIVAHLATLQ
jgi:cytochrome c